MGNVPKTCTTREPRDILNVFVWVCVDWRLTVMRPSSRSCAWEALQQRSADSLVQITENHAREMDALQTTLEVTLKVPRAATE